MEITREPRTDLGINVEDDEMLKKGEKEACVGLCYFVILFMEVKNETQGRLGRSLVVP